jgi:hypothetical protein
MKEMVTFKNKRNHPLPINLGGGNSISVAAKGTFECTQEEAKSAGVVRETRGGRIKLKEPIAKPHPVVSDPLIDLSDVKETAEVGPGDIFVDVADKGNTENMSDTYDAEVHREGGFQEASLFVDAEEDNNPLTFATDVMESEEEDLYVSRMSEPKKNEPKKKKKSWKKKPSKGE